MRRLFAWLAAMRLEVTARKSGFLWRRTDDRRYPCVFSMGMRRATVFCCGHYVLGVCTDETSADCTQGARQQERMVCQVACQGDLCTVAQHTLVTLAQLPGRISARNGFRGIGRNLIPHHFLSCMHFAEAHAVSVRRVIPRRARAASCRQLLATRVLVLCHR